MESKICLYQKYLAKYPMHACVCVLALSRVQLFVTLWTIRHQAPLSMGFPRQEYWSGLPFPPPGIFPTQESNPCLLLSPELAGRFFTIRPTPCIINVFNKCFLNWIWDILEVCLFNLLNLPAFYLFRCLIHC